MKLIFIKEFKYLISSKDIGMFNDFNFVLKLIIFNFNKMKIQNRIHLDVCNKWK